MMKSKICKNNLKTNKTTMDITLIIMGGFIILLLIVIYGLGRYIKKLNKELEDMDIDLQEYSNAADDAKTITKLKKQLEK